VGLTDRVTFGQPPDSSLIDHVHRFNSLQRPPRALKRGVSFGKPDPFLHGSVILLDDVVQVFVLAESNPARQDSFVLQRFDGRRIRPVLIHVYDAWGWVLLSSKHFVEEGLAASMSRVAVSRKSMVWPVESIARYRYRSLPLTFM
jgi:hypothetical protein